MSEKAFLLFAGWRDEDGRPWYCLRGTYQKLADAMSDGRMWRGNVPYDWAEIIAVDAHQSRLVCVGSNKLSYFWRKLTEEEQENPK